tara:strand:+ start:3578 stop:4393 length:816 start_codon:yes stop_codon:yes gene_type:complete
MKLGDLFIGKRLFVGCGKPNALGTGPNEIRGSAYVEGPLQVGRDTEYSEVEGTVMIAREANTDIEEQPNRSLYVKGNVRVEGDDGTGYALDVSGGAGDPLLVRGDIICDALDPPRLSTRIGNADDRPKPFDLKHPIKEGWRLRYACIEGPEVGVYARGRITNKKEIQLPYYWKGLVHEDSISIQLQPIGSHQNIIVKRWDESKIYLQSQGGMPIDCFYHVYAERKDINPLITEYEGETCRDYPDPNHHIIHESERNYNDPEYRGSRNTITM